MPCKSGRVNSNTLLKSICLAGAVVAATCAAHAQVAVYTGYNDEPRAGGSFSGVPYAADSGQPNPWYGSANTTYYGNAGTAQAFDPDIDAILLQNWGGTAQSLTAASIGGFDLFNIDGIGGPVNLAPGANVILAGVDGSDFFGSLQTVSLTIGGNNYSYLDVALLSAPGGALSGASPWIGGSESEPWTPIHTPTQTNSVPDDCPTLLLTGLALGALGLGKLRRSRRVATATQ